MMCMGKKYHTIKNDDATQPSDCNSIIADL